LGTDIIGASASDQLVSEETCRKSEKRPDCHNHAFGSRDGLQHTSMYYYHHTSLSLGATCGNVLLAASKSTFRSTCLRHRCAEMGTYSCDLSSALSRMPQTASLPSRLYDSSSSTRSRLFITLQSSHACSNIIRRASGVHHPPVDVRPVRRSFRTCRLHLSYSTTRTITT